MPLATLCSSSHCSSVGVHRGGHVWISRSLLHLFICVQCTLCQAFSSADLNECCAHAAVRIAASLHCIIPHLQDERLLGFFSITVCKHLSKTQDFSSEEEDTLKKIYVRTLDLCIDAMTSVLLHVFPTHEKSLMKASKTLETMDVLCTCMLLEDYAWFGQSRSSRLGCHSLPIKVGKYLERPIWYASY